jgi:hypothetical protein
MTQREIIYDIREKLKLNSDDIDITDDYLAHLIDVKRVYLIKQRFSKFTKNIPEEVKQVICLDLEVVESIYGEPCFGDILTTKEPIPGLLEIGGRSALVAVRVMDMLHPHINIIPTERLPYVGYNKWLKKQIYVALDANNKLYFKSDNSQHLNLKSIKVVGVFADPKDAEALSCAEDSSNNINCDFKDVEYPIEAYLVSDLVNLIVKELAPGINVPNDNVNNADASNRN